ncbi:MAG TPA: hypothetical protein VGL72_19425 [Bryobacteraceae bacterium]
MPQISLDFIEVAANGTSFALEVETAHLMQAVKRVGTQAKKAEWIHLEYHPGLLVVSAGEARCELRAAGSWPQVISVARSWAPALLGFPLTAEITSLRVESGKLYAQELGVACLVGADRAGNEEIAERQKHVNAAAAALHRYGVTAQEIEQLVGEADGEVARLWGRGDEKAVRDVATAWQCLASYGVEASAIRRLLVRKSRDLWKDARAQTQIQSRRLPRSRRVRV